MTCHMIPFQSPMEFQILHGCLIRVEMMAETGLCASTNICVFVHTVRLEQEPQ